jgi:hypothetical protein
MPNTIQLRRSAVASAVPTTAQLALGELAINTFDGKLYLKRNNGTESIVEVGAGGTHNSLTGRSDADAHPISAITGLQAALDGKQKTITVGTTAPVSPSVGDLWVDTN